MIKRFFDYTEIRTKITSIYAFLLTIAYLYFIDQPIDFKLTLIFFMSMFLFDLTTTAVNNYIDTKTNGQMLPFSRKSALFILYGLLGLSAAIGLYLACLTDIVVLLAGGFCFICGVLYTYGPLPISRQPLGEILSGLFYGLLIPFILIYINTMNGYLLSIQLDYHVFRLEIRLLPMLSLLLLSIAPACATANIMLANNICDIDKDIKVKRYTLPFYLGVKKAVNLFAVLYYISYAATAAMVALKLLSPLMLLTFLTLIPVQKNIQAFRERQIKSETFICSIKNYVLIMTAQCLLILISGILNRI